jgi:hypothetical protein
VQYKEIQTVCYYLTKLTTFLRHLLTGKMAGQHLNRYEPAEQKQVAQWPITRSNLTGHPV